MPPITPTILNMSRLHSKISARVSLQRHLDKFTKVKSALEQVRNHYRRNWNGWRGRLWNWKGTLWRMWMEMTVMAVIKKRKEPWTIRCRWHHWIGKSVSGWRRNYLRRCMPYLCSFRNMWMPQRQELVQNVDICSRLLCLFWWFDCYNCLFLFVVCGCVWWRLIRGLNACVPAHI